MIGDLALKQIIEEFKAQGHNLSGRWIKSLEYRVKFRLDKLIIEGYFLNYGSILNVGVRPEKIPFGGTKRGSRGKSKYIEGLMLFAKKRFNIRSKKAQLGAAIAIAKNQKKQGMPSTGSFQFSKTGKRTGFLDIALEKIDERIDQIITSYVEFAVERKILEVKKRIA